MSETVSWFHGSEGYFGAFDTTHIGSRLGRDSPGFWFSNNEQAAGYYGPNIVQCDLALKNPFRVSEEMFVDKKVGPKHWARFARGMGHDSVIIEDICDGDLPSTVVCVFSPDLISGLRWKVWDDALDERVEAPTPASPSVIASTRRPR